MIIIVVRFISIKYDFVFDSGVETENRGGWGL